MSAAGRGRWGRTFECGPFAMERYGPSMRWLKTGGVECIRMIGVVVRDQAWRTMAPLPSSLRWRRHSRGMSLSGTTPIGRGRVGWQLELEAREDGIELRARLDASGQVVTNRAGLVVLLVGIATGAVGLRVAFGAANQLAADSADLVLALVTLAVMVGLNVWGRGPARL